MKNLKLKQLAGFDLSAEEQKILEPGEEALGEGNVDSAMLDVREVSRDGSALLTAHWNVTANAMREHQFYISDAVKAKQ